MGIGIGYIYIKLKHGGFGVLSNVLQAPNINKTSIYASQISDLVFKVKFNQGSSTILDINEDQIARGTRIGNLYSIDDILLDINLSLGTNSSYFNNHHIGIIQKDDNISLNDINIFPLYVSSIFRNEIIH